MAVAIEVNEADQGRFALSFRAEQPIFSSAFVPRTSSTKQEPPAARSSTPGVAFIPRADLKPHYDFTIGFQACQAKLSAAQNDLVDEKGKTAALTKERDDAVRLAKGGSASPARPSGGSSSSAPPLAHSPPKPANAIAAKTTIYGASTPACRFCVQIGYNPANEMLLSGALHVC